MHLLAGEALRIDDGDVAVDLGQPPGDIVILSSADSELAALAEAARTRAPDAPSVRFANLGQLGHPMSVDLYVDKTARQARLVVVRAMGGAGYWPHGLERLRAESRSGGPLVAVMPGEDKWDAGLEAYATVAVEDCRALWRYLVEGGPDNATRALAFCDHLIGRGDRPDAASVLPHAGLWRIADLDVWRRDNAGRPVAPIVFYRALVQGNSAAPIGALADALRGEGLAPLPIYVTSLKDRESETFLRDVFAEAPPAIVLNTTSFAVSRIGEVHAGTVLDEPGRPVLQVVLAGSTEAAWRESPRGLLPRDLTMNVVLPEVDGRILTRAVSFKASAAAGAPYAPNADRIRFVAAQAAAWVRLGAKAAAERRVALVLSNYPDRDGRIANGVGLDTPASATRIAAAMSDAGYSLPGFPRDSAALMALLLAGPTNARLQTPSPQPSPRRAEEDRSVTASRASLRSVGERASHLVSGSELDAKGEGAQVHDDPSLSLADYRAFFAALPESVRSATTERWGEPESDPCFAEGVFRLAAHRFGNVVVAIQPQRGYSIDPKATYHDPALVPPHGYLAFYAWLRSEFGADAIVHVGKHGNLEWLPGKALGLSASCWPEVVLGPVPLIYPFIVNDPGEGSQAKRRASAVIVDHLMPPMTRAETYGPLAELETLIDEYYLAAGMDKRRREYLAGEIVALAERHGLDRDLGLTRDDPEVLRAIDAHLCELKEMQIRDGLHILGASPGGRQRIDTLVAIARSPRGGSREVDASLHRAIADDLGLGFDPLDCDAAEVWSGPRPAALAEVSDARWRTCGDTVERIELLAAELVGQATQPQPSPRRRPGSSSDGEAVASKKLDSGLRRNNEENDGRLEKACAVLAWIAGTLAPRLDTSGDAEIAAVLAALDGRFVAPGPSGAPTRGRPEVLPTGRNFYSVDVRAVPTAAAWALGRKAADAVALRYFQDEGEWPRSIALSAWGTSNMRTGGDDIAQAMAFIGAEPVWEAGTGRVTGFRVLPLAELGRPRIDVTLKISGMFRDAFPAQIDLLDSAMRAVAALPEDGSSNPLAASGLAPRIFGARPEAYGAGLQALIDTGAWETRADLVDAFVTWGAFAYGGGSYGAEARDEFAARLKTADAVLHNQDNREHDVLDSDDYYQFQGGLSATVEALKGAAPRVYHGDHARPEKPVIRALDEEIARVVRGRAANPKWIAGVMRHGYKGAFEMAATVDYLFAFAATTNAVKDHHFDQLFEAYLENAEVRAFIADNNAPALREMAGRLREAIDRGLWAPRRNSTYDVLSALIAERRDAAE